MSPRTYPVSRSCQLVQRAKNGFTLIEMMIVVALIAILSAVAIPSYSDYVRRGKIAEGFAFLADYRIRMEQFFQDNRNYGVGNCATPAAGAAPAWANFANAGARGFNITCDLDLPAAGGFTITATGRDSLAGNNYTIDNEGTRATTRFKGAASAAQCWLTRDAQTCN